MGRGLWAGDIICLKLHQVLYISYLGYYNCMHLGYFDTFYIILIGKTAFLSKKIECEKIGHPS